MTTLDFVVLGEARPAGSKTAVVTPQGRRNVFDSSGRPGAAWKREVKSAALDALEAAGLAGQLLEGPLAVRMTFYRRPLARGGRDYPTTRPDVLKLARAVEDALTTVVWRDDAEIVAEGLAKLYGTPERVEISITEV
jgi:Holliday junction resolvase RusA-like endonuclease